MLIVGVLFYFLGWFPKIDAAKLARWMRSSGTILISAAVTLAVTRNLGLAALAGLLAYWFTQGAGWFQGSSAKRTAAGSISTVRTAYLELSLDHATGAMSGRLLRGRFAGRALADLDAAERVDCLAELRANDAQAARLYEAYLDRTAAGWNAGAGSAGARTSQAMSVDEAYLVLGLDPGASPGDIHAAHRNLMKRFHPDQGGTNYLAAKVNEAKDVLLRHTGL